MISGNRALTLSDSADRKLHSVRSQGPRLHEDEYELDLSLQEEDGPTRRQNPLQVHEGTQGVPPRRHEPRYVRRTVPSTKPRKHKNE